MWKKDTSKAEIPKEQIVTKRYEKEATERKNHLQDPQAQRDKAEKDLLSLKAEILACIKGESVLPRETLAEMITEQEEKLTELENLCESASEELEKTAELMGKVSRLYDELISYADLYDSTSFEAKKNDCQSAYPQGRCLSWVSAQHYLQPRPYAVHGRG